jgi:hypothetical protein
MQTHKNFSIDVRLSGDQQNSVLMVNHPDETFVVTIGTRQISIINNGDNSWSLVTGDLSQENVNIIGQAIEDVYRQS